MIEADQWDFQKTYQTYLNLVRVFWPDEWYHPPGLRCIVYLKSELLVTEKKGSEVEVYLSQRAFKDTDPYRKAVLPKPFSQIAVYLLTRYAGGVYENGLAVKQPSEHDRAIAFFELEEAAKTFFNPIN